MTTPDPQGERPVKRYRWHDDGMWLLETEAERRITTQWVMASDYDAVVRERDALRTCYDGLLETGNKILAERDALRVRVAEAEAERDAARYRHCREHGFPVRNQTGNGPRAWIAFRKDGYAFGETADTAIDTAMAEGGGG